MSKAEKFIREHTKKLTQYGDDYFLWITPEEARKAVKIAREEIYEKQWRPLVAEIERQMTIYNDDENIQHVAKYNILVDIRSFLDTLEVKGKQKPINTDTLIQQRVNTLAGIVAKELKSS